MRQIFFKRTGVRTLVLLYCLIAVSSCTIIYTAVKVNSITFNQSFNYNNHLRYHIANACFRQGTDLLTDAVRRYVVTGKPEYMEQYFQEANEGRHRNRALEMVRTLEIDQSLKNTLFNAMKASKGLMHTEYYAMHLIAPQQNREILHREVESCPLTDAEQDMSAEQRHHLAEELLWDDAYVKTKIRIYSYLSNGLEKASAQAITRHLQLKKQLLHMLLLSAVSWIAFMLGICGIFFYRRSQREQMIEARAEENARMNARLQEEHDKLIKAEKARSYFFSSVSHDIRTPLNSIIGFSEMLQLGIDDPEEQKKALDAIITSAHTLLELINDVLDLSKLESGKMELRPVPTNIANLVDKVTASFEVAISGSPVKLGTEIGKMPFLMLDPQRIRQILFNLIGNAVKFTKKGSITVRAAYENGALTLAVADTGCGISEENLGKLMSPYVQLLTQDNNMGTGLGLAICKQLSKQMKGTLEIESAVGKGSTFTLRIPHVEAVPENGTGTYSSPQDAPKTTMLLDDAITEKRMLIVDDQKLNLKILQAMLARLGVHKVLTAENGKDALETLNNSEKMDMVLTDMSMPVMDGAELVNEIRKSPRLEKIPVYVITADVEMQGQYRQMGFDDILIKPITLGKLKELLMKYAPRRLPDTSGDDSAAKA